MSENSRFILNLRSRRLPLILWLGTNEPKWKDKYYFSRGFICVKLRLVYPKAWEITCKLHYLGFSFAIGYS